MKNTVFLIAWAGAVLVLDASCLGQNLMPNPSFGDRRNASMDGPFRAACGRVVRAEGDNAADGQVCIAVEGDGKEPNWWRTADLALEPGGLYCFGFMGRRAAEARGGTAMSGPSRVNRDFPLGHRWEREEFIFMNPHNNPRDFVRLGQWEVGGRLDFDRVELVPVFAAHAAPAEASSWARPRAFAPGCIGSSRT